MTSMLCNTSKDLAKRGIVTATSRLHQLIGSVDCRPVGILMYHRVVDRIPRLPAPTWNVPPARFREQLVGLLERDFEPCALRHLIENQRQPIASENKKSFVVTFDDAHESVYRNAWPVLKELRIPATIFLSTAYLDSLRPFPFEDWNAANSCSVPSEYWRPLSSTQCCELAEDGLIELAAHTHTHQRFAGRLNDFERDLAENIEFLWSRFRVTRPSFAFPYGIATPAMMRAVHRAGLRCGLTTNSVLIDPKSSPFGWGRFNVESWDTAATLAGKLNGWYSWVPRLRQRLSVNGAATVSELEPAV